MSFIDTVFSNSYFYLIYLIILYLFSVIIKTRKQYPDYSSRMLLILSFLLAFFATYLFIRSLGSGYRYGSGHCGLDGCFFTQPVIFTIDDILFHLLLPMIMLTAFASLVLILRPQSEKRVFEGASIIFSGSLLFIFFMLGIAPLGIIGIIATMFLARKIKIYLNICYAIIIMYLYPVLLW